MEMDLFLFFIICILTSISVQNKLLVRALDSLIFIVLGLWTYTTGIKATNSFLFGNFTSAFDIITPYSTEAFVGFIMLTGIGLVMFLSDISGEGKPIKESNNMM